MTEWSDSNFVTCTACDDYDLCIPCHVALKHGHDPKHAFIPAVEGAELSVVAQALLAPGRNQSHNAICDGCDKYIYGVRHKCVDCPDWDYCSACVVNASFVHPLHKFVPMYEPSPAAQAESYVHRVRHHGIYCDGPLCNYADGIQTHIKGVRYKCAVCHDVDFCAVCEANPANPHNKTHPLIKFKTPVRNVSVTTLGDHEDGRPMPIMGDRRCRTKSKATETTPAPAANAATQVQTVADLKPTQATAEETPEVRGAKELPAAAEERLTAHFIRDAVPDGTVLAPNTVFEQTWYLRNGGSEPWPAGCTVKFTGGDNMCAVDPQHPASIHELVSAGESTTCYTEVAPGQEAGFTVLLRTASKPGTCLSYWRLTTPSGSKFGHRLWCDVVVREPSPAALEASEETVSEEAKSSVEGSQMIFPTLEKESPTSSIRVESQPAVEESEVEVDEFEEFTEETLDDETEDGFLTDEEYDILDASDEEYLAEQQKTARK
jgi:next-to-BRCA1 protein 1